MGCPSAMGGRKMGDPGKGGPGCPGTIMTGAWWPGIIPISIPIGGRNGGLARRCLNSKTS